MNDMHFDRAGVGGEKKHTLSPTRALRLSVGVTVVLQAICRCYCRVTGVPVDVTSRYRGTS